LAADPSGTVYVGGQGEFGYLRPDARGTLEYASLLEKVPKEDRQFADVWNTVAAPEGIYF
ncbi:MAG: hypothetical protein ABIZ80_12490, partial [Bryobacteraceae bacterium]